jgi:hypothetical protein
MEAVTVCCPRMNSSHMLISYRKIHQRCNPSRLGLCSSAGPARSLSSVPPERPGSAAAGRALPSPSRCPGLLGARSAAMLASSAQPGSRDPGLSAGLPNITAPGAGCAISQPLQAACAPPLRPMRPLQPVPVCVPARSPGSAGAGRTAERAGPGATRNVCIA